MHLFCVLCLEICAFAKSFLRFSCPRPGILPYLSLAVNFGWHVRADGHCSQMQAFAPRFPPRANLPQTL